MRDVPSRAIRRGVVFADLPHRLPHLRPPRLAVVAGDRKPDLRIRSLAGHKAAADFHVTRRQSTCQKEPSGFAIVSPTISRSIDAPLSVKRSLRELVELPDVCNPQPAFY
jgi:hypothetical protein